MNTERKLYSIKKIFFTSFSLIFAITFVLLVLYASLAYSFMTRQTAETIESALRMYRNTLEKEMDEITSYQDKLIYNNSNFMMLTVSNLSSLERIIIEQNTRKLLESHVSNDECIFVNTDNEKTSLYVLGSSYSSSEIANMTTLKRFLLEQYREVSSIQYGNWNIIAFDGHSYLTYGTKNNGICIISAIQLDKLSCFMTNTENSNLGALLFIDEQSILSDLSYITDLKQPFETLSDEELYEKLRYPSNHLFTKYTIACLPVSNTSVYMSGVFHAVYKVPYAKLTVALIILLILILFAFFSLLLLRINTFLLYPLEQIHTASRQLGRSANSTYSPATNTSILEFRQIDEAIAELVNTKNQISDQMLKEAFEKNRAVLQYFQLQTRSHFIINCLKSLNGMAETGDYAKMKRMLIAFSSHLRYIFRDNLELVSLADELDEVNDYYNIILLDRTTPIILNQQIDQALLPYKVPSLIIQTFLENTIKYNKENRNLLIFDLKITETAINGVPAMQIMIGDNGVGYSQKILDTLNSTANNLYADKHVGIENLKHRIDIIYRSNYEHTFYNSPAGGAKAVIILPLLRESPQILHGTLDFAAHEKEETDESFACR